MFKLLGCTNLIKIHPGFNSYYTLHVQKQIGLRLRNVYKHHASRVPRFKSIDKEQGSALASSTSRLAGYTDVSRQ